ncbi:MAG: reprolysin-like metallopeptidase [Candidatus Hydrogenedentota bacterium]
MRLTIAIVVFCIPVFALAQAEPPSLLLPDPSRNVHSEEDPKVLRARPVLVDLDVLSTRNATGSTWTLPLFDGETLKATVTRTANAGIGTTCHADVAGKGKLTLHTREGVAMAVIDTGDGRLFDLRMSPHGQMLRELDPPAVTTCATSDMHSPHGECKAGPVTPLRAAEPTQLDVLVAYTAATRAAAGGAAGVEAEIAVAVDLANTAYVNSAIDVELNLVHATETAYVENGDMGVDLALLTGTEDGFMDELHGLRNTYGADLVALLVEDGDACGVAWIMEENGPSSASLGFSVTDHDCIAGQTFAHELGHNMGCAHDRENASGGIFPYSWGWRFSDAGDTLYRTVMSYAPGFRINHFSNPDILFEDVPTGAAAGEPPAATQLPSVTEA